MIYIVKKDENSNVEQLLFCKSKKKENYKFNSKKAKALSTSDFFNGLKDFVNPEVIIKEIKLDNNVLEVDTFKTVSASTYDKPLVEHIELVLDDNLLSDSKFMTEIAKIIKGFEERKTEIELLREKRVISFYKEKSDIEEANDLFKNFIKSSNLDEGSYNQMLSYYLCLQDNKEKIIKNSIDCLINMPLKAIFKPFSKLKWPAIIMLIYFACFKGSVINSIDELFEVILIPFFIIVGGCFYDINYKQIKNALTGKMNLLIDTIEKKYGFTKEMEKDKNDDLLVTYLIDDMNYARTHQKDEDLSSIMALFKRYNKDVRNGAIYLDKLTFIEAKLYSDADTDTIMKVMNKLVADIDKRLAFLGLHNYDNKCVNLTKQIIGLLNDNQYEGYEKDILNLLTALDYYVKNEIIGDKENALKSQEILSYLIKEKIEKFKLLVKNAEHNEEMWKKCADLLNGLDDEEERPEYDNNQELKYPGVTGKQE